MYKRKPWMSPANYNPSYWNNKGKHQAIYEKLSKELVPLSGKAASTEGEILRQLSNFYYDRYNNGHCNSRPVPAVRRYLKKKGASHQCVINMFDDELDRTVDFILENLEQDLNNKKLRK